MSGYSSPLSIKWQSCYLQNICVKKSKFHRTLLALWSIHVCALLPGFHWPLWRLAWNNGELLTQASLLNGARRLDHCDVIALLSRRALQSWHSKPNVIHGNSFGTKHKLCVIFVWISDPAGMFMSVIRYHTYDCSYLSTEGVIMLNRFPTKRWPHHHFHWELNHGFPWKCREFASFVWWWE